LKAAIEYFRRDYLEFRAKQISKIMIYRYLTVFDIKRQPVNVSLKFIPPTKMEQITIEINKVNAKIDAIEDVLKKPFQDWSEEEKEMFGTIEQLRRKEEQLRKEKEQLSKV